MLLRYPGNARMSSAVKLDGTLYLKGVTPGDTKANVEMQTRSVLDQIDEILAKAGSSREKVVKVSIWLRDINDFDRMNAVYDDWVVRGHEPVRACVEARLANPDMKVEIQVEAAA